MEFSKEQLSLFEKCSAGFITKDELLKELDMVLTFENVSKLFLDVMKNNDKEMFSNIFNSLSGMFSFEEDNLFYTKYLLEENHFLHSDMASAFQTYFNTKPENLSSLLLALENIPKYLSEDDFKYPYIRKIIYAIGAQPEPYNIQTLEKLSTDTDDSEIKELALHQIDKRKKLGRWESINKNQDQTP